MERMHEVWSAACERAQDFHFISGVLWSLLIPAVWLHYLLPCEIVSVSLPSFISGHVSTMWFMVCRWPQSQEGDWPRPHLCRFTQHGPWPVQKPLSRGVMREIETCLLDSRVGYNRVDYHRSRWPVLSPLLSVGWSQIACVSRQMH